MTKNEIKSLVNSMPSSIWKKYFTDDEWLRVVDGLYKEYKKYSNIDIGFSMYYQAGLLKLVSNNGHNILRQRFL